MRHLLAGLFVVAMFSSAAWARPSFDYGARDFSRTARESRPSFERGPRIVEQQDRRNEARSAMKESPAPSLQRESFREKYVRQKCAARANGGCGHENTGSAGEPF